MRFSLRVRKAITIKLPTCASIVIKCSLLWDPHAKQWVLAASTQCFRKCSHMEAPWHAVRAVTNSKHLSWCRGFLTNRLVTRVPRRARLLYLCLVVYVVLGETVHTPALIISNCPLSYCPHSLQSWESEDFYRRHILSVSAPAIYSEAAWPQLPQFREGDSSFSTLLLHCLCRPLFCALEHRENSFRGSSHCSPLGALNSGPLLVSSPIKGLPSS